MENNRNNKLIEKLGAAVVFIGCLAALVLDNALHLHFTNDADALLIIGTVLGALDLL